MKELIEEFNSLIDRIENRCMASDGPVTPTLKEMREDELARIWQILNKIKSAERFKMPTDKQVIHLAILFNDGKIETEKLTDMVALVNLVIDRLYENGDVTKKCSKE